MEEWIEYIGVKIVQAVSCVKDGKPGYTVRYKDGYESWCPKDAFEEANRRTSAMPFGHAVAAARKGRGITRAGWNGKGLKVLAQFPDANGKMTLPYLYIEYPDGKRCPWLASQTDIMADDWSVVVEIGVVGE